jgi:hypothetical protein
MMPAEDNIKLALTSLDVTSARLDRLREIFPEAFAAPQIEFQKSRQTLGTDVGDSHGIEFHTV